MTTPHETFAEKLLDLAYGELPPRAARELEAHVGACEACRVELLKIRETRRLMGGLPEEPAPEQGERILLAAAREAAERRASRRRLPTWLLGAAAVAASIVVVAVSYRLVGMRPGPMERREGEALLGESPYAARESAPDAPLGGAPAAKADAGSQDAVRALDRQVERLASSPAAPPRSPPPAAERKRAAPSGDERQARVFAEPPPAGSATLGADALRERPAPVAAEGGVPSGPAEAPVRQRSPSPALRAERLAEAVPAAPDAGAARAEEPAPLAALEREAQPAPGGRAAAKAAEAPSPAAGRALAFAAPLRQEVRVFEGCEGESRRSVETDGQGRVVRYVREGTIAGRRVRITHAYRPDGGLAALTAVDLDAGGAAVDARALGATVPERAGEARLDAPPRCGR